MPRVGSLHGTQHVMAWVVTNRAGHVFQVTTQTASPTTAAGYTATRMMVGQGVLSSPGAFRLQGGRLVRRARGAAGDSVTA